MTQFATNCGSIFFSVKLVIMYVKLTCILFIYLRISMFQNILFLYHLITWLNYIILKLRNIEYQFNTKF